MKAHSNSFFEYWQQKWRGKRFVFLFDAHRSIISRFVFSVRFESAQTVISRRTNDISTVGEMRCFRKKAENGVFQIKSREDCRCDCTNIIRILSLWIVSRIYFIAFIHETLTPFLHLLNRFFHIVFSAAWIQPICDGTIEQLIDNWQALWNCCINEPNHSDFWKCDTWVCTRRNVDKTMRISSDQTQTAILSLSKICLKINNTQFFDVKLTAIWNNVPIPVCISINILELRSERIVDRATLS